ncbi:MAG: hypothetical protein PHV42_03370 [Candidatus Pacebacteria bacterium]|nr:hypothetical protein [Candidatus Paceibacterota bacterium]
MLSKSQDLKRQATRVEDELRNLDQKLRDLSWNTTTEARKNRQEKFDLEMKDQKLKREMNEIRDIKFRQENFKEKLNQLRRSAEIEERREKEEERRSRFN